MNGFAFVALALVPTLLSMLGLRVLAGPLALIDTPDRRKRHQGDVPLVGGIAMFIGIVVAAAFAYQRIPGLWHFIVPAALLVAVGVVDDRFGVGIVPRFGAQIGAVLIMMVGGGLLMRDIGDPFGTGLLGLGPLAVPISVLITVTVINAFNFIDGIDGLAASMALITLTAGILVAGSAAPTTGLALIACGALVGFMVFNFPGVHSARLRSFMGDAGSTLLGFTVVWFTISITQGQGRSLSPVIALWFALVPLADFFSCFVLRIINGKVPLAPGREHFHYMLKRGGFTDRQTVAVLVGFALLYAGIGIAAAKLGWPDWPMFLAWMLLLCTQYKIIQRIAVLNRVKRRGRARR